MGQRRMFSLKVVDTDDFLEMPQTCQLLYFHLAMRADDDGFVNCPNKIMRFCGSKNDDMKVLETRQFIIPFQSGVIVIRHWKEHNSIRKDRKVETLYKDELSKLTEDNNGVYELTTNLQPNDNQITTKCPPKLSKVKLSKVKLSKVKLSKTIASKACEKDFNFSEYLNKICNDKQKHIRIIGYFIYVKGYNLPSKEAVQAEIKRNLRAAKSLICYEEKRIGETMKWLNGNADFKWGVETVGKYINEDLNKLYLKTAKLSKEEREKAELEAERQRINQIINQ